MVRAYMQGLSIKKTFYYIQTKLIRGRFYTIFFWFSIILIGLYPLIVLVKSLCVEETDENNCGIFSNGTALQPQVQTITINTGNLSA